MPDLQKILNATAPLTLASIPRGAQPLVMADLARADLERVLAARAVFAVHARPGLYFFSDRGRGHTGHRRADDAR